jgi:hypothetical protein
VNSPAAEPENRERIYLALLCQGPLNGASRSELEGLLSRHSWRSQDHHAVFQALAEWRAEPEVIRAALPAQLTRLGFPDTDIDDYFAPLEVSTESALGWLRAEVPGEPGLAPGEGNPPAAKSK